MSGIVGILHLDGSPVERSLLDRLTQFQSFRGPDGKNVWLDGHVGFGHTLLKTTEESERESQPFTLDGNVWIVADCRIDAQRDLIVKLRDHGREIFAGAPDVQLILHAYMVWGGDCVDYLLGDFAFAIWDGPHRRLFCARDHMGVKPFFYAHIGETIIFSNTLDCIRQHPAVSDELNDQAIGDFLLLESNMNPATTIFSDIQKLSPAHRAAWIVGKGFSIERYWALPIDEPIFYKKKDDYTDRFRELLRDAIDDRLRTNRLGVFMSGGLDSPTLAAMALGVLKENYENFNLQAFTNVDDFLPKEREYAESVAVRLGISIHFHKWDDQPVDPNWERLPFRTPEPYQKQWQFLIAGNYWSQIGANGRVFFWGEGPDNALTLEWKPYLGYLFRKRRYARLVSDSCATIISQRRLPFSGRIIRRFKNIGTPLEPEPSYPDWFNPEFEERFHLRERWVNFRFQRSSSHPIHPEGYASLQSPLWPVLFEGFSPEVTKACIEMRHPYVDLRVLRFLLSVPVLPWCRSKYLLRRAMREILPPGVLRRVKAGASGSRVMSWVASSGLLPFEPVDEISTYVNLHRMQDKPSSNMWILLDQLRIRSLNHWLQYSVEKVHTSSAEAQR